MDQDFILEEERIEKALLSFAGDERKTHELRRRVMKYRTKNLFISVVCAIILYGIIYHASTHPNHLHICKSIMLLPCLIYAGLTYFFDRIYEDPMEGAVRITCTYAIVSALYITIKPDSGLVDLRNVYLPNNGIVMFVGNFITFRVFIKAAHIFFVCRKEIFDFTKNISIKSIKGIIKKINLWISLGLGTKKIEGQNNSDVIVVYIFKYVLGAVLVIYAVKDYIKQALVSLLH